MSKSIYEKALESLKKHREVTDMIKEIKAFEQALEQAQKQEKLLELYKEFYDELKPNFIRFTDGDYESYEYLDFETDDPNKCMEIFKKIKEIENE